MISLLKPVLIAVSLRLRTVASAISPVMVLWMSSKIHWTAAMACLASPTWLQFSSPVMAFTRTAANSDMTNWWFSIFTTAVKRLRRRRLDSAAALADAASMPLEKGFLAESGKRALALGRPNRGPRLAILYLRTTAAGIFLTERRVGSLECLAGNLLEVAVGLQFSHLWLKRVESKPRFLGCSGQEGHFAQGRHGLIQDGEVLLDLLQRLLGV